MDSITKPEDSKPVTKLNPKQEMFARLYASDAEFFANGTQSYIEAYEPDKSQPNWYKSAQASASRMLSNVKICNRINEILELKGLNDSYVDKQLEFLITQHTDFSSKMKAIAEYNKLKSRITQNLDLKSGGELIGSLLYAPKKLDAAYDSE
jgi:hypothetical protein